MDKNKRETFHNLELLQQENFNVCPLVTQYNILPENKQGKRQVYAATQAYEGAIQYRFR